ncbi:MAG: hypothetical protein Q8K61_10630 [Gallionella sp.]|nr:hypothetical protein [Gallionella sp.]
MKINTPSSLEDLSDLLAGFRRTTGSTIMKWDIALKKKLAKKCNGNENELAILCELVIELNAVLAEADGLSRQISSILDGTGETVPIEDLFERYRSVVSKANKLNGRWKSLELGVSR